MEPYCKRILLFLFGCIPTRLIITYLAKTYTQYLVFMSVFAGVIATGFASIYLLGLRQTGPEVFGDKIWWNALRPVHATLWGVFAFMAFHQNTDAWKVLLLDTLFGLVSFLVYHGRNKTSHISRCLHQKN